MKTWYRLAFPLLVSSLAYACTITTSDDDDDPFWDEDGGSAGSGNRAGSGVAGSRAGSSNAGRGGSSAGSGGSGTAGTSPTGGTAGTGAVSDLVCPNDDLQGTPAPSTEFEDSLDPRYTECVSCLQTECDAELKQCYASQPDDPCGWGETDRDGANELFCYIECLVEIFNENGFIDDTEGADHYTCATSCGSQYDGAGNACNPIAFSLSTQELTECLHTNNCDADCVDGIAAK